MRKTFLTIVCALCAGFLFAGNAGTSGVYECGTWLQLVATPFDDYHFVEWSDGNVEPVRTVEVNEDATYIAYFAANCEEYANWPVVALYDWLLMVNVNAINQMGYYISPANVTWYRVVGEPDDMHNAFPQDDQVVIRGSYYLTLAQNLQNTGNYYAVVDVSNAQGMLCDGLMRTVIINYSGGGKAPQVNLLPNYASPGQQIKLVGLNPNEKTAVQIFSTAGQLVRTFVCEDTQLVFPAEYIAGCYQVKVSSPSINQVLKYLVRN